MQETLVISAAVSEQRVKQRWIGTISNWKSHPSNQDSYYINYNYYNYTMLHKIRMPLFSFYNFSKCWSILMKAISLCLLLIVLTCYNVFTHLTTRSGAHYKNGCTRPKSRTSMSYVNALWSNGISRISTSSTKPLESGKRDFKFVWLQEEDNMNTRCEHFSLLTLSCAIFECVSEQFLNGTSAQYFIFERQTLWLFAGWLKCTPCATMHNWTSTTLYKKLFNK